MTTDDEIGPSWRCGQVVVHTIHSMCSQSTTSLQHDSRCPHCFVFSSLSSRLPSCKHDVVLSKSILRAFSSKTLGLRSLASPHRGCTLVAEPTEARLSLYIRMGPRHLSRYSRCSFYRVCHSWFNELYIYKKASQVAHTKSDRNHMPYDIKLSRFC
jgi:hypothetical protein